MDYGYVSSKDKPKAFADIIYDAMTDAFNKVFSLAVLERLSKIDYEHEDSLKLRKFIEFRTNTDGWPEDFFSDNAQEGSKALRAFCQDMEDVIAEKTGNRYGVWLSNQPEFNDGEDEIINRYEKGTPMTTADDLETLYGYKTSPEPIMPKEEEIKKVIYDNVDFTLPVSSNTALSEDDVYRIMTSTFPIDTYDEIVDFNFSEEIDRAREQAVDEIRKELPMLDRQTIEEYIFEEGDIQPPFEHLLDEEYCCVLEFDDKSFPIINDNGPKLIENSTLELLYEKMGYSLDDINKALADGVPDKIKSFPSSLAAEYAEAGEEPNQSTVILLRCKLRDLLDDNNPSIKIPVGSRCGFFNSANGSGGGFKIMIEKDVDMPRMAFSSINVDYRPPGEHSFYSVHDVYTSLGDDLWDPIYTFQKERKQAQAR